VPAVQHGLQCRGRGEDDVQQRRGVGPHIQLLGHHTQCNHKHERSQHAWILPSGWKCTLSHDEATWAHTYAFVLVKVGRHRSDDGSHAQQDGHGRGCKTEEREARVTQRVSVGYARTTSQGHRRQCRLCVGCSTQCEFTGFGSLGWWRATSRGVTRQSHGSDATQAGIHTCN
jgi:hypothetical protein